MFKPGDVIKRKAEFIDPFWKHNCKMEGVKTDVEVVCVEHTPEARTVRFKFPNGYTLGVYDFRMELVDIKLENE